jgi:potassium channel LctB
VIGALALAIGLFLASVGAHLSILGVGHRLLDTRHDLVVKLAGALLVLGSHLLVASLFAAGFWLGAGWGLGGFDKAPAMSAMDYFYFSLINVTTLGLGDIYPTEHLRVLAGIEALTGFALISCSAQLFWSMMKKGDVA